MTSNAKRVKSLSDDMAGKFMLWGTLAFGVLTWVTVAEGDAFEARLVLAGVWMIAVMLAQVLRHVEAPDGARQLLGVGAWMAFAGAQWLKGASALQVDPWQVMAWVTGAALVGRVLAVTLGWCTLGSMVGLGWAHSQGTMPEVMLGRSIEARVADDVGLTVFMLMSVVAVLSWVMRLLASEQQQITLAAGSAEKFKSLFLDSPTPMVWVEADQRSSQVVYALPDKRKNKKLGPKLLAFNAAFADTFESSVTQNPQHVSDLWRYKEDFETLEERIRTKSVVKGCKTFMVSWRSKRKMVCLASASRSTWEGVQAVLWTFQDVTEIELLRHRLERQNRALSEKLESTAMEARYDALTLLPNRRALEERVLVSDGAHKGDTLCAFMIDVDCFKKYNDSLGHQAGDVCLAKMGEALAFVAAEWGDRAFAARYGGEEFTLLVVGFTPLETQRVGQSICDAVCALNIDHPDNTAGPMVTVSVGGSVRRHGESTTETLKRADSALYRSKMQGRNQVQIDPEGLVERR